MPESPNWSELVRNAVGGSLGVKVGPGVLLVVGTVMGVGLAAAGAAAWALQASPWLAFATAALILLVAAYFSERAFRYAIKNPIPALMGGAELLKYVEHQMAAKDPSIITTEDRPQIGTTGAGKKPQKRAGGAAE